METMKSSAIFITLCIVHSVHSASGDVSINKLMLEDLIRETFGVEEASLSDEVGQNTASSCPSVVKNQWELCRAAIARDKSRHCKPWFYVDDDNCLACRCQQRSDIGLPECPEDSVKNILDICPTDCVLDVYVDENKCRNCRCHPEGGGSTMKWNKETKVLDREKNSIKTISSKDVEVINKLIPDVGPFKAIGMAVPYKYGRDFLIESVKEGNIIRSESVKDEETTGKTNPSGRCWRQGMCG